MLVQLTLKQQQQQQQQQPQSPLGQGAALKAELLQAHLTSPPEVDDGQSPSRSSYTAAWVTLQAAGVPDSSKPSVAAASTSVGDGNTLVE
jgi:hypothetical protein